MTFIYLITSNCTRLRFLFYLFIFNSDNLISQLERSAFFDDTVRKDMFFLTVHDAVLYIRNQMAYSDNQDPIFEKVRISSSTFHFLPSCSIHPCIFSYSIPYVKTRHRTVQKKKKQTSKNLITWTASVVHEYFAVQSMCLSAPGSCLWEEHEKRDVWRTLHLF